MRWLVLAMFLMAFSPVYTIHDSSDKVDTEIKQIANDVQDKSFDIDSSTPNLSDFKDGQFVIFKSTAVKIMFRAGNEIYAVQASCVTVRR